MSRGFNSRRTDPPRTINFINGHNGVPKANLLNMHNKKLIARRPVALLRDELQLKIVEAPGGHFIVRF
jgi:hypothetical protein